MAKKKPASKRKTGRTTRPAKAPWKADEKAVKRTVRSGYARIAKGEGSCCGPKVSSCSCCGSTTSTEDLGRKVGYSDDELGAVPEGANLGLGCGNPTALAQLKKGETVLDLGSGAGFDCFLAATKVGSDGHVIGVDMTPEMIDKARQNADKGGYGNVEFRLGEIESLPVEDCTVDVVISNCVINLSPDKPRTFQEAFRVLRPGGRLMVSDIVLLKELPEAILKSAGAYIGCVAGAMLKKDYLDAIKKAGFKDVKVNGESTFPVEIFTADPTSAAVIAELGLPLAELAKTVGSIKSIKVSATKPDKWTRTR